jgi:hypothetical protein
VEKVLINPPLTLVFVYGNHKDMSSIIIKDHRFPSANRFADLLRFICRAQVFKHGVISGVEGL